MPRTIKAEGKTYVVPDDATDDEINQIVGPAAAPALPGIKNPVNADTLGKNNPIEKFGQDHPYVSGALALVPGVGALSPNAGDVGRGALKGLARTGYEVAKTAGPVGLAAGFAAKKLGLDPKVESATEPSNEGERVGSVAEGIAEMAVPGTRMLRALPIHADRAAENFQTVMRAAKDVPIDIGRASGHAMEAKALGDAGAALPKVMSRFSKLALTPTTEPMTYQQGRRFAMNAGRLSAQDALKVNPPMRRQVAVLASSLNEANEGAAASAGVGNEYRSAMREYRNAKRLERAGGLVKKYAPHVLLGGGLIEGGRRLFHRAIE